jgi:hypothetical protein
MKQKGVKITIEFLLVWPSTAGLEVCNISETPLEKTVSFVSDYQLMTTSGLGVGDYIHFSLSTGTPSGLDMW